MCFVIISGGIDLSVGLDGGADRRLRDPVDERAGGARSARRCRAVVLGAVLRGGARRGCSACAHGLLITKGRIEPFIVTLGTLGIFRAYLTYFADGGALTLDNALVRSLRPVYYASLLGMPVPVWVFLVVAVDRRR